MDNQLLIAILAGLGGMLGWGFADFSAKKTIDQIGDMSSLAWGHIFGTLTFFIFILYKLSFSGYQILFPKDFYSWIFLILFGIVQATVYFFLFKGFGKGQVSLLSPIFASFAGITAILSMLIFNEILNGNLILALIVIFTGIILINLDIQTFKTGNLVFTKILGLKEVVIATLLASLWTLFWGRFVNGQDWLMYSFLMYAFMTLAILVIAKFQKIDLKIKQKSHILKFLIFIGLGEVVAYLAISLGYSQTEHVSIVAVLSGAFSLPVLVLAKIFLKEKITSIQTVGAVVIIIGIVILSLL